MCLHVRLDVCLYACLYEIVCVSMRVSMKSTEVVLCVSPKSMSLRQVSWNDI